MKNKDIEPGLKNFPQLYNLNTDIAEQQNLADSLPQKVQELEKILLQIRQNEL